MSEYIFWQDDDGLYKREEIVRCRDCRFYKCGDGGWWCLRSISTKSNHPDGFCAWGERLLTCKCGEEMETEGVCHSCGRLMVEQ